MGVAPDAAASAIRISLGWASSGADVDRLVAAWAELHARTRGGAAAGGRAPCLRLAFGLRVTT